MQYIYIILILFFCYKIFFSTDNVIGWYILGICTLYNGFGIGNLHVHFLLSFMLIVSMLKYKYWFSVIKEMPCINAVYIYLIGLFLVALFGYENDFFSLLALYFREIILSILILPVSYFFLKKKTKISKFQKFSYIALLAMFVYGILEIIGGKNWVHEHAIMYFNDYAFSSVEEMNDISEQEFISSKRFRVESLPCFSFDFGFYSALLGLFLSYMYYQTKRNKYLYTSLIAGIGGAIASGSRIVILSTIICFFIFYNINTKAISRVKYNLILIIVIISSVIIVGNKTSTFTSIADLYQTGGKNMGGSSLDLRMDQLSAATYFFMQSPFLGNGIDYLGKGITHYSVYKQRMWGSESIIYQLMIESGITGLAITLFLFITFIRYHLKYFNNKESKFGISIICLFLIFSIGTGVQGAWFLFMPFIAYSFK